MKIVFVGLGGVPFSNRATDVRLGAFADLFVDCGHEVEIINRFSMVKNTKAKRYDIYEPFRDFSPSNIIIRLLIYIVALFLEPLVIIKSHWKRKIDILFASTGHFADFVVYRLISWLIGAKLVNQYCEAQSSFEYRNIYHSINGYLVDNVSPKLWDGAVCISHYLESTCVRVNKNIKTTIVYPFCDFTLFDECKPRETSQYILFCGSIGYKETIDFILQSYRNSCIKSDVKLRMVLAGDKKEIHSFQANNSDVIVESGLSYNDLIRRYKEAFALLIPLRNNIRDIARFPNKTCEYCAARGVVVTTDVGEMSMVFKDLDNALVASNYAIEDYSEKLNWLGTHNSDAIRRLKENSYMTGLKYFSLRAYDSKMRFFLEDLIK